jgi:hypothetical protein
MALIVSPWIPPAQELERPDRNLSSKQVREWLKTLAEEKEGDVGELLLTVLKLWERCDEG